MLVQNGTSTRIMTRLAVSFLQPRHEQGQRIGQDQAHERRDEADDGGDLHDAPERRVLEDLDEDLQRQAIVVGGARQHGEDRHGIEHRQVGDERHCEETHAHRRSRPRRPGLGRVPMDPPPPNFVLRGHRLSSSDATLLLAMGVRLSESAVKQLAVVVGASVRPACAGRSSARPPRPRTPVRGRAPSRRRFSRHRRGRAAARCRSASRSAARRRAVRAGAPDRRAA